MFYDIENKQEIKQKPPCAKQDKPIISANNNPDYQKKYQKKWEDMLK